jgi:CDP-glycerol glycerophosphotransferase (TagB/SpsB family)
MVDILFFDYWTRGIRHFSKIKEGLDRKGLTSLLLHLGSRRGEDVTQEEIIDGVLCRNITFYRGSIVKAIIKEKPKLVLLLNNQTEDKIIIRACRALRIKTVFLMHGVLAGADDVNSVSDLVDSAFGVKSRLTRIPKYVNLYFQYLRAASLQSIPSMCDPEIHSFFLRIMLSPGKTITSFWRYSDSVADVALVYSDDDKKLFVQNYGYNPENVKVVGNYNLDTLYSYFEENTSDANLPNKPTRNAKENDGAFLYIENGFSDPKYQIRGWTEELVTDEIIKIAELLTRHNFVLYVKLHPSSDYSFLIDKLSGIKNIKLFDTCDLSRLILESDVVLGQSSSVLMMALAVDKPILLLSIPPLEIKIRQYLDKNAGTLISSMSDFECYVQNFSNKHKDINLMNRDSRDRFVGPFDGKCNQRIVNEICRTIT